MKRIYLYMVAALMSAVGLFSCADDKGSYDYLPVNEVTISGIASEYNVIAGVTELIIEPEIMGTQMGTDDSNYEYSWYACLSDVYDNHSHTTLSNEKNLHVVVNLAPTSYRLYLTITDNSTGLEWLTSSVLYVSTPLTTGFYVFGDKEDGTVGMDFLSLTEGGDSLIIKDIFTNERGLRGAEDLIFTGPYAYNLDTQALWAVTEDGSYKVTSFIQESSVFDVDENFSTDNLFYPQVDVKRPIKVLDVFPHQRSGGIIASNSSRGYMTEDAVYVASIISAEAYGDPMNRYDAISNDFFTPYKVPFYSTSYVRSVMLYDMDNERFTTTNSSTWTSATSCRILTDADTDAFPWNQTNRTIVYGDNCSDGYSYALMKDTENTDMYYVYVFQVYTYSSPQKYGGYSIDASQVTGFADASHYTFFVNQPYLLYSVGSQLWGCNYVSGQAVMLRDFGSEITYLAFDWVSGNVTDIVICTYDSTNKGTIYKYTITDNPNVIEITPMENCEWKTDLRVKKLEYRNSSL